MIHTVVYIIIGWFVLSVPCSLIIGRIIGGRHELRRYQPGQLHGENMLTELEHLWALPCADRSHPPTSS